MVWYQYRMTEVVTEERAVVVNVAWKHGGQWWEQAQELKVSLRARLGSREVELFFIRIFWGNIRLFELCACIALITTFKNETKPY